MKGAIGLIRQSQKKYANAKVNIVTSNVPNEKKLKSIYLVYGSKNSINCPHVCKLKNFIIRKQSFFIFFLIEKLCLHKTFDSGVAI